MMRDPKIPIRVHPTHPRFNSSNLARPSTQSALDLSTLPARSTVTASVCPSADTANDYRVFSDNTTPFDCGRHGYGIRRGRPCTLSSGLPQSHAVASEVSPQYETSSI